MAGSLGQGGSHRHNHFLNSVKKDRKKKWRTWAALLQALPNGNPSQIGTVTQLRRQVPVQLLESGNERWRQSQLVQQDAPEQPAIDGIVRLRQVDEERVDPCLALQAGLDGGLQQQYIVFESGLLPEACLRHCA